MNEKHSLLITVLLLIHRLTSSAFNLHSECFDLTTFQTLSRSCNAIEGKFERFLLTLLMDGENAFNDFSNAIND